VGQAGFEANLTSHRCDIGKVQIEVEATWIFSSRAQRERVCPNRG